MESNYFETLRKNTLTKDQVEVRIAEVSRNGFTLVVYKTRNADKNILDKIVGPENWQKGHNGNPYSCYIEIWDPEKKMWIHKENFGESVDRSTKGSATDSMKRAGEDWGIGRELYTCPRIFIGCQTVDVNYGTGFDLPEDIRATYDKENVVVSELVVDWIDEAKVVKRVSLSFADGTVFYTWDRSKPSKTNSLTAVSALPQEPPAENMQVTPAPNAQAEAAADANTSPAKEIKKTPTGESPSPTSNKNASAVLLETAAQKPVSAQPESAPEITSSSPAPAAPLDEEFAAFPDPMVAVAESKQNVAIAPQDVIFTLLDGYDPQAQGLRVYQGKTMGQLLAENPNVINLIASPTFKWEAKMEREIWEAAKETIRLSRM